MEDEKGVDEKIIAVPTDKLHPFYSNIASYRQLPPILWYTFATEDYFDALGIEVLSGDVPGPAADLKIQDVAAPGAPRCCLSQRHPGR